MTKDGLRCVGGADVETPLDGGADDGGGGGGETSGETSGSLRLPLVWANEATGRLALMPHTRCVEPPGDTADESANQETVVLGTKEARSHLHGLMRRSLGGRRATAACGTTARCGTARRAACATTSGASCISSLSTAPASNGRAERTGC